MAAWGKFAVGLVLVFLIGIGATTQSWFPGSKIAAQQRLQRQAEYALADTGGDWAQITIDGQKAILTGTAPSPDVQNDTIAAVKNADWGGGLIVGGITAVDTRTAPVTASLSEETAPPIEVAVAEIIDPIQNVMDESEPPAEQTPQPEEQQPTEIPDTENSNLTISEETTTADATIMDTSIVQEAEDLTPSIAEDVEENCQPILEEAIGDSSITFASAQSEIDSASRTHLLTIADRMNECPNITLVIAGHTDSQGGASGNRQLSLYRADAIATYLRSVGVDGSRLQTRGFGESAPIASNANASGRAQNRRIEFTLISDGSE